MKYDGFLEKRQANYDRWLAKNQIRFSSKVIPVGKSLEAKQWVLPSEQALGYLKNARSFALADCDCRTRYKRCDNPVETCFFMNDGADRMVKANKARRVTLEEAEEVLRLADEHGLVHLTIYTPDQHPLCVCSCCTCCCHDLQLLMNYGRDDLIAKSEYQAVDDSEVCVQCGACVERCVFGARVLEDDFMIYDPDKCYGCGLCVSTCPSQAISLDFKEKYAKASSDEDDE